MVTVCGNLLVNKTASVAVVWKLVIMLWSNYTGIGILFSIEQRV